MTISLQSIFGHPAVRAAVAVICGLAAVAAFSIPAASWMLPVSLGVLFLFVAAGGSVFEGALLGWLWGVACFSAGLRWCFDSMHLHGGLPAVLAAAGVFLLAAYLALFPAVACAVTRALPLSERAKRIVLLPALWTLAELLRGVWPVGFGWLSVGYAFASDFFSNWAPVLGVYGVSFVVCLTAGFVAELLFARPEKGLLWKAADAMLLGVLVIGTYALGMAQWSQPSQKLEVRLIQPDLPVVLKFDKKRELERIDRLVAMSSRSAMSDSLDLIIWPESAFTAAMTSGVEPAAQAALTTAKKTGAEILFNAFFFEGKGRYYNSLWHATPESVAAERIYGKHHLVPFGEFVPMGFRWFVDLLGIPMSDQQRGPAGGTPFKVAGINVAAGICYENMFGEELRLAWKEANPRFVVNVANLGWFSEAVLPQFTQMSAMRARETARPVVQSLLNAGSVLIGPDGRIERSAGKGAQNLDLQLVTATGEPTIFVRYGHGILVSLLVLISFVVGIVLWRRREASR